MSRVSCIRPRSHISKRILVEAFLARHSRTRRVDRHEDHPRDDPDGQEDLDHHSEIHHERVRVEPILFENYFRVRLEDTDGPAKKRVC